jgi:hypothetical protein
MLLSMLMQWKWRNMFSASVVVVVCCCWSVLTVIIKYPKELAWSIAYKGAA